MFCVVFSLHTKLCLLKNYLDVFISSFLFSREMSICFIFVADKVAFLHHFKQKNVVANTISTTASEVWSPLDKISVLQVVHLTSSTLSRHESRLSYFRWKVSRIEFCLSHRKTTFSTAIFLCVLGMYEVFMVKSPGAGNLASLKKNLGRGCSLDPQNCDL